MREHPTTLREELQAVWDAVPGDGLLAALEAYHWTGRRGHSLSPLWRAYVVSYYLNLPHTNALIRRLQDDDGLRVACGFGDDLPSRWTFNRFWTRLADHSDLVQEALGELTDSIARHLPGFGETVAVDSTTVRSHSNPNKRVVSDLDAGWTAKEYKKGAKQNKWYWGFKLHLTVDTATELPITAHVTAGNHSDTTELMPALRNAKARFNWFQPKWVLADKGYDSAANFKGVAEELGAVAIIDVRKIGYRGHARETRACEAYPVVTPDGVRYRCERQPWDPKCPRFESCPLLPTYVDSDLNPPHMLAPYERWSPFPYGSSEWKTIYARRSSVERVNSRLKECRRLERHCFRGLAKVTLHALLSVTVMQATALAHLSVGDFTTMRWSLRRVA